MQTIKILLLISIISLTSCYSTKRLIRENDYTISDFNKENINGIYIDSLNTGNPLGLWNTLKSSYTFKIDSTVYSNNFVELTLTDNENLNVKLLNKEQTEVIEEFNLKGETKGSFFSIDRNLTLIPFPPIYYLNRESKTLIANDISGNLVVVRGKVGEGMIFFMASGNRGITNYKFDRIKN